VGLWSWPDHFCTACTPRMADSPSLVYLLLTCLLHWCSSVQSLLSFYCCAFLWCKYVWILIVSQRCSPSTALVMVIFFILHTESLYSCIGLTRKKFKIICRCWTHWEYMRTMNTFIQQHVIEVLIVDGAYFKITDLLVMYVTYCSLKLC